MNLPYVQISSLPRSNITVVRNEPSKEEIFEVEVPIINDSEIPPGDIIPIEDLNPLDFTEVNQGDHDNLALKLSQLPKISVQRESKKVLKKNIVKPKKSTEIVSKLHQLSNISFSRETKDSVHDEPKNEPKNESKNELNFYNNEEETNNEIEVDIENINNQNDDSMIHESFETLDNVENEDLDLAEDKEFVKQKRKLILKRLESEIRFNESKIATQKKIEQIQDANLQLIKLKTQYYKKLKSKAKRNRVNVHQFKISTNRSF